MSKKRTKTSRKKSPVRRKRYASARELLEICKEEPIKNFCFVMKLKNQVAEKGIAPSEKERIEAAIEFIDEARAEFGRKKYVNISEARRIINTHFEVSIGEQVVKNHIKSECNCAKWEAQLKRRKAREEKARKRR